MKILNIKNVLTVTCLLTFFTLSAQRNFFGAGFSYLGFGNAGGAIVKNGGYYEAKGKIAIMNLALSYSRYSSVRRGYTLSLIPLATYKESLTSTDGTLTSTYKASGFAFGLGTFGLIASDYQSKNEVHMCNFFSMAPSSKNFYFNAAFGFAVRHRINKNIKAAFEFYPLNVFNGRDDSGGITWKNFGIKLYYAP